MRNRVFPALLCVAGLAAFADTRQFGKQIGKDEKVLHALSRLTYGARPGDAEAVRKLGVKKWVEQQLHPERLAENPVLEEKLKWLDSLRMPSQELVRNYPTPQMARQMAAGQIPFPDDPERRRVLERVAAGAEGRPDSERLAGLLTPVQMRQLRNGTPDQRIEAFQSLPAETQGEVLAALPPANRQALMLAAPPELRRKAQFANGPAQVVAQDLAEGKLLRAVYSNRQLGEILADFWYNHFNVHLDKGADRYLVTEYEREAIRPHVLGRFRDLLAATAKSPAMLFYLDNWQSVGPDAPQPRLAAANRPRRGLNENYGRELLELHTLGVDGGYTQKDVTEVARCFTGWTINQPQRGGGFTFNPRMHDRGEKVVLGVTIPAGGGIEDGETVLDILSRRPATARFISRKLAQRFVADEPPAALVERMARTFQKTGGDLRAVMKTMLDSKEFWSQGAYLSKVKSPLELVASAVRASKGEVSSGLALANQVAQMGQPLYRKADPTGYPNSSREWLNSAGLLARLNFATQLAHNRVPGVRVDPGGTAAALGSPEFQKR